MITKAARRYASALLQIGIEQNNVESLLSDIEFIKNTLADSRELKVFLKSPIIKFDDKLKALNELFGDHVGSLTSKFMELLARKDRVRILPEVVEAFIKEYNEHAGIIEVNVYSARQLDDRQRTALHEALEAKTGKTVNMQLSVDASLRGGLAVRIDDTVIDGTIKHKLEQLEETFLSSAAE